MGKKRLDVMLVEGGFFPSREQAKRALMAGEVFINGEREDKAGTTFDPDKVRTIEVKADTLPFVSRGGLKLEKALRVFEIDLKGATCLDIGASTGGFTDCMLQAGAKKVYAVDVGYGQLAYSLSVDERVVSMERTNFRNLTREDFDTDFDFATADVSFISLDKILPVANTVVKEDGRMVVLVKPQFEAGRDKVGKNGVVRDKAVHKEVIEKVLLAAKENAFFVSGLSFSPVTGPKGNIEYLLYLNRNEDASYDIDKTVEEAHVELLKKNV